MLSFELIPAAYHRDPLEPSHISRVGITKVLIEWEDYQSESFGELIFRNEIGSRFPAEFKDDLKFR